MIKSKKTFFKLIKTEEVRVNQILANIDKFYYEKKEPKLDPFGKQRLDEIDNPIYRILHPSKGELKFIQQRIKNIILSQIKFSPNAFGGVKGKSNILNAKCHKGKKYKFVTDLRKFFPSIKPFQIYQALIDEGFSPDIASMITKLCTYNNANPQGAPTSTHLANLVFKKTDKKINALCSKYKITYSRFVDDLAFSSPIDFKDKAVHLIQPVIDDGFNISHKKTKYGVDAIEVTGVWVYNNQLDVSDKMKDKLATPEKFTVNQNIGNANYSKRVRKE